MPIKSLRQFLDFLKFSILMPFRLGWSILGILLFGMVLLVIMYLFGYSVVAVEMLVSSETVRIYGAPSLGDRAFEFLVRFIYEFLWQLWAGYIFVSILIVALGKKPIISSINKAIRHNYKAVCQLALMLTVFFTLLPMASMSLGYRSEIYQFHYYMVYAIAIFFVFSLIEIIQNDKSLFEALSSSILLLRGRYIFTFIILSVLMAALNHMPLLIRDGFAGVYGLIYPESYQYTQEDLYFYRKTAYLNGVIKAALDMFIISIYSGAVIYLYKLYVQQGQEKATQANSSP